MSSNIIQLKEIKDSEFILFRDIIYKESGISLSDHKKALMQSRLYKRLKTLKLNDYTEYYNYLQENYKTEIVNLLNCITTNKTEFFREDKHFQFIYSTVLPALQKKAQKKIMIWSAGCSTGQEPYSIAMTLCNYYDNNNITMPDIKILATDIDTEALETGRKGSYRAGDIEGIDKDTLNKYFKQVTEKKDTIYQVNDNIRAMIQFSRLNLLDETYPMKDKYDMIFCRNVIIYFDNVSRTRVFEKFYEYLNDDGYFFAGHSENIKVFFKNFSLLGNTIYVKYFRK